MGADSHWSSPLPWGTPSITSTRTTRRASSFSARRWAAVAPTFPAPTTVILFSMTIVVGEVRASYTEPLGLGSTLCGQAVIGVGSGIAPSPQRGVLRAGGFGAERRHELLRLAARLVAEQHHAAKRPGVVVPEHRFHEL